MQVVGDQSFIRKLTHYATHDNKMFAKMLHLLMEQSILCMEDQAKKQRLQATLYEIDSMIVYDILEQNYKETWDLSR